MTTSQKVLVTGGAGFIGSHLGDELVSYGYEVFCIDNLITGSKENIAHLQKKPRFHFINHNVVKPLPKNVKYQMSNIKYLYHLASPASPVKYRKHPMETLLVNSFGTYNMLRLAQKERAVFILASTSEVYGDPKEHPQKETYFGNCNPVGKRSCYDESKRFAEAVTQEFARSFNLPTVIIRIFNTYGPRMSVDDGRVVSNFITQALSGKPLTLYGDGQQTRSFCYISDMVKGIVKTAEGKKVIGKVINLGNPHEVTIKQLGEMIIKLSRSSSTIKTVMMQPEDDPARRKPDIRRARQLLNWQPKVTLEDGLKKTINYFSNI